MGMKEILWKAARSRLKQNIRPSPAIDVRLSFPSRACRLGIHLLGEAQEGRSQGPGRPVLGTRGYSTKGKNILHAVPTTSLVGMRSSSPADLGEEREERVEFTKSLCHQERCYRRLSAIDTVHV